MRCEGKTSGVGLDVEVIGGCALHGVFFEVLRIIGEPPDCTLPRKRETRPGIRSVIPIRRQGPALFRGWSEFYLLWVVIPPVVENMGTKDKGFTARELPLVPI